jgi:hypothetical protein
MRSGFIQRELSRGDLNLYNRVQNERSVDEFINSIDQTKEEDQTYD